MNIQIGIIISLIYKFMASKISRETGGFKVLDLRHKTVQTFNRTSLNLLALSA